MHYLREIAAFTVDPREEWIYAATIGGQLLSIRAEAFEIGHEAQGAAGGIESVAVRPTLPYLATLAIEHTVCLWDLRFASKPRKIQTIALRDIHAPGYEGKASLPLSCPLAFHPTERRLLTHSATGAMAELSFDDTRWDMLWAECFFEDETARRIRRGRSSRGGAVVVARSGVIDLPVRAWPA